MPNVPIPATVVLRQAGELTARTSTDEDGEFAVEAEPGGYVVTATPDPERLSGGWEHYADYECEPERVRVPREDHARLTLSCHPPEKGSQ